MRSGERLRSGFTPYILKSGTEIVASVLSRVARILHAAGLGKSTFGQQKTDQGLPLFDATLLLLGILGNCVEHNVRNRDIMASSGGTSTIAKLFGDAAVSAGISFAPLEDDSLESNDMEPTSFSQHDIDSLIMAGQAALAIGCMVRSHPKNLNIVRTAIKNRGSDGISDEKEECMEGAGASAGSSAVDTCVTTRIVCRVLDAFLAFQNLAGVLTPSMMADIVSISEQLKSFVKAEANASRTTLFSDSHLIIKHEDKKEDNPAPIGTLLQRLQPHVSFESTY